MIPKIVEKPIEPNAITALFGVIPPTMSLSSVEVAFIAFVTLPARHFILLRWKSPTSPSHTLWINNVVNYVKLERIRWLLGGSLKKFSKIWDPFFKYLHELNLPDISD